MFNFEFLVTPIGLIIILTAVFLATMHVLSVNRSLKDTKATRDALLEQAKFQSLQSFTAITSVTKKANEVYAVLSHLDSHAYKKLQVVVVIEQTAYKNAKSHLEAYKKAHSSLDMRIVVRGKNTQDRAILRRYAKGEYVIRLTPKDQLTKSFFQYASYALTHDVQALRIRSLVKPEVSLTSGFISLLSLWRALIQYITRRSIKATGLIDGVIVKRSVLEADKQYQARAILHEEFAIVSSAQQLRSTTKLPLIHSIAYLLITAAILAALSFTYSATPSTIFVASLLLLLAAYVISSCLLLLSQKGLTFKESLTLILLIPFYPFWIIGYECIRAILSISAKSIELLHSKSRTTKLAQ
ncbi:MAG: hypothetical protein V4611_03890 [Patescibacteria group bacterium]